MQISPPLQLSPLDWVTQHLGLLSWPTLLYIVWRVSRFISKIENRATSLEDDIKVMKDNHLHSIQEGINTLNTKMDYQTTSIVSELRSTRELILSKD